MDILMDLHTQDAGLSVIMITAYGTVENAVRAMQSGAANFIQKPWDNEKLLAMCGRRGPASGEEENIQLSAPSAALQLRAHRRQERGHAEDFRPGRPGRAQPVDGAVAGREWHGEGTDRQSDSPELATARAALRSVNTGSMPPICWNPLCSDT